MVVGSDKSRSLGPTIFIKGMGGWACNEWTYIKNIKIFYPRYCHISEANTHKPNFIGPTKIPKIWLNFKNGSPFSFKMADGTPNQSRSNILQAYINSVRENKINFFTKNYRMDK